MPRRTRRNLLAALGASATFLVAGCTTGDDDEPADTDTPTETPTDTDTPDDAMAETATPSPTATDDATATPAGTANVRIAHLSPNAPNVDVSVDGTTVLEDVPFEAVSDYLAVPVGTRTVRITAAGDPDTVAFEGDLTLEEADYTVAAVGSLGADERGFEPLVLEDDTSEPDGDTARVRLVHASPDAPAVDVTTGGSALFEDAAYGDAATVEVPAGTYTLRIRGATETNDGDVVAVQPIEVTGGTAYTVFAGGYLVPGDAPGDEPFGLTAVVDAGAGGGLVDPARVRVGHFSPDAPNVDVSVDGAAVLEDVPYRALSEYLTVPSGTRSVAITAAGDPDTSVFEGDVELGAADYTVAAVGELSGQNREFRPLVLEDDNSDPGEDQARVRLVHASPDAPAVDVTVAASGNAIYDGVGFGDTGSVTVPANDYTLEVRGDTESNDGDVVADFDVSLNGGTVYTAVAAGYLVPEDAPADEPFDLQVAQDASY
jgi:hypothetical protein